GEVGHLAVAALEDHAGAEEADAHHDLGRHPGDVGPVGARADVLELREAQRGDHAEQGGADADGDVRPQTGRLARQLPFAADGRPAGHGRQQAHDDIAVDAVVVHALARASFFDVLSCSSRPTAARSSLMSRARSRSGRLLSSCAMRSDSPSAMALSLWWTAWSLRVWLFCNRATIRKVMIVVAVLMISCQVSTSRRTRTLGAQITMSSTQKAKNAARPTTSEAIPAKRSKTPTRADTSVGMRTARFCPMAAPPPVSRARGPARV